MVSIKVPNMAILPCFVGLLVYAAACAIAALPRPASFEKIPLANPQRIASQMDAPIPDSVSKALPIIRPIASGNTVILLAIIKIEKEIKTIAITGTTIPAKVAILFIPPMITIPVNVAINRPVNHFSIAKLECMTSATELDCTVFPIPKAAIIPKKANNIASQCHAGPSPFWI